MAAAIHCSDLLRGSGDALRTSCLERRGPVAVSALVGCVLGVCSPIALAVCEAPRAALAEGAVVADRQAQAAWAPVQGAAAYRVRVHSRVPNGRVVASHDTTVTATLFRPPQPLADQRAKVTLRLRAVCGAETSAESTSWFLIDTSAGCRLGDVAASSSGGTARIDWKVVPSAQAYDVRAHALTDGRLIASEETRSPLVQVALREAAVVSVRPRCTIGEGEAVYRVVTED